MFTMSTIIQTLEYESALPALAPHDWHYCAACNRFVAEAELTRNGNAKIHRCGCRAEYFPIEFAGQVECNARRVEGSGVSTGEAGREVAERHGGGVRLRALCDFINAHENGFLLSVAVAFSAVCLAVLCVMALLME